MARIVFNAVIDEEAVKLLDLDFERYVDQVTDLRPVWKAGDSVWKREIGRVFQNEGNPDGEKWVGLSKTTAKERKKKGFGAYHPILVRTGRLRDSVVGRTKDTIDNMYHDSWLIGTTVPYGTYHQSRRPRRKLPRRAFLVITNNFKGWLVHAIHKYAVTGRV